MPIITLTTDYGTRDHYVAAMKGAILSIAPSVTIVDVTHDVQPHDIVHGAFVLRQVWSWFPKGTIHVAVVDPGVGSERRILVGQYDGRLVIAPDNGLITFVERELKKEEVCWLENTRCFLPTVSKTFHGRDIMGPVAAHLANGARIGDFGRPADRVALLPVCHEAESTAHELRGEVIYVDHFGTLVTNVRERQIADFSADRAWAVWVDDTCVGPIRATYSDVPEGEVLALLGSSGYLEIAINRGHAIDRFGHSPVIQIR